MSKQCPGFSMVTGRLGRVMSRIGLVFLVALALVLFEVNTAWGRNLMIEVIYGSYHWVPCSRLPTPEEVQRIIDEHPDIVGQIHAVSPGHVSINVNENPSDGSPFNVTGGCLDKADLLILFPGVREKDAIRKIIGDDRYFFGVPYRLHNT